MEPTIIRRSRTPAARSSGRPIPSGPRPSPPGWPTPSPRILQQNIQSGTGTKAKIGRPAAGKTGTAQDNGDAWFCGYTPHLSTAVWMGNPERQVPMTRSRHQRSPGGSFPAEHVAEVHEQGRPRLPGSGLRGAYGPGEVRPILQEHSTPCGRRPPPRAPPRRCTTTRHRPTPPRGPLPPPGHHRPSRPAPPRPRRPRPRTGVAGPVAPVRRP